MYSDKLIFVFGSNRSGIHGAGAAAFAHKKLGAEWGVGEGLTGFCYALPTKTETIDFMSADELLQHIKKFVGCAALRDDLVFNLSPVGCGLGGYDKDAVLKMFKQFDLPENILFDSRWFGFNGG